jgi:SAM-dependent methyltransferase
MHKISFLTHNWLALRTNNEDIKRRLPMLSGTVYDLGCGTRPYEKDILAYASKYVGVDWSNTLHELSADIVADLNKPLPIEGGVAHHVVSFQVLEHLREPQTMLNEAFRILQPGGNILLSVPFQWWLHEAPYDYFRYTRYGLEHLLTKAGFVDVDVQEVNGFWVMWFLKLNYQTCRLIRGPWLLRWTIRIILLPLWLLDQVAAPLLDRIWSAKEETTGYFVCARKPRTESV